MYQYLFQCFPFSRHTACEYAFPPLSQSEIDGDLLRAPIPPVWISAHKTSSSADDLIANTEDFMLSYSCHHTIDSYICSLLENSRRGTTEDTYLYHPHTNSILDIICELSGMTSDRDCEHISANYDKRCDAYVFMKHYPAVVLIEEKTASKTATHQLSEAFNRELPHYGRLGWIIGITSEGDEITIGKLPLAQKDFIPMATFSLDHPEDRIPFVRAVINVARWCSWVRHSGFLHHVSVGLEDDGNRRRAKLTCNPPVLIKVMYPHCWSKYLIEFYTSIACANGSVGSIPHMEWAINVLCRDEELQLTLKPFGVARQPEKHELRSALRCVLTALSALHHKRWVHLDVRWSNIVWCGDDNWVLIDAEFARPFGAVMPKPRLGIQDDRVSTADAAADLYCVSYLLEIAVKYKLKHADDLQNALRGDMDNEEPLEVRSARTATWALSHPFFTDDA